MIRDILYFLGFGLFIWVVYAVWVKLATGQWLWQVYKQKKKIEKRWGEEHIVEVGKIDNKSG